MCALCGHPIDKSLPANHPMSWTADHIDPLSDGGAEIALSNLRPAHMRCNSARGNGKGRRAVPLPTSETW